MKWNNYAEMFKGHLNYTGEVGEVDLDGLRSALKTLKLVLKDHDGAVKAAEEAEMHNAGSELDIEDLEERIYQSKQDRKALVTPAKPDMEGYKQALRTCVESLPDDADELAEAHFSIFRANIADLDEYVEDRQQYLSRCGRYDREIASMTARRDQLLEEGPHDTTIPELDSDLYHEAIHDVFEAMGIQVPEVELTMPDEEDMQPIIDWANHYALDRRWQPECRKIADRLQEKDGSRYEIARTLLEFTRRAPGHFAHPDEPEHGRVLVAQGQARSNLEVMGLSRCGYVGLWDKGPRDDAYVKKINQAAGAVFAIAKRK